MDEFRFEEACGRIIGRERVRTGIGTLSEKTLHAVLKQYYEPDPACQEIPVGRYVADILTSAGIIEIQTRAFNRLREKLAVFLQSSKVTVVYPIAQVKWLCWIDQETGEVTKRRRSPKTGTVYEAFFELYRIKAFLDHPNLELRFPLLELEEYRCLDGWSTNRKRGSTRFERIPVTLMDEICIRGPEDYGKLIPDLLPDAFTSREFAEAVRLTQSSAQTALRILHHLDVLKRTGKEGRMYIYERNRKHFP